MTNEDLHAAQLELERDAIEIARERYKRSMEAVGFDKMPPGQRLIKDNIGALTEAIAQWGDDATNGKVGRSVGLASYICQFDPEEVAFAALRRVAEAIGKGDQPVISVALNIVKDLEAIDLTKRLKEHSKIDFKRFARLSQKMDGSNDRRVGILRKRGVVCGAWGQRTAGFGWDRTTQLAVGTRLIELTGEATNICKIEMVELAGFKRRSLRVMATEVSADWIEHANRVSEIRRPVRLPMVIPPKPWTEFADGGYLTHRLTLIKANHALMKGEREAIRMPLVLEAVNRLQETAWAVNTPVLDVLCQTLSSPDSLTGLPGDRAAITEPPRPGFLDFHHSEWTDAQKEEFVEWKREVSECKRLRNKQASKRTAATETRDLALRFRDYPAIYFPHTLDWRGRAYPVSNYLQPQGNDLAKGLLRFASKVPLGTEGSRWLLIHGANNFGVDKVDMDTRVEWVGENMPAILASAEDPLDPSALWVKADSPFQFLAFCLEVQALVAWLKAGNPAETFESSLPVTIDGSCNGLQHFSAMLKDEVGGAATNLVPADKPSDIYGIVAEKVKAKAQFEATSDDPEIAEAACFWTGVGLNRKWAKRNTMTLAYGVTALGMVDQLWEEINDLGGAEFFETAGGEGIHRGRAVRWLAASNWEATSKTVIAARAAMDWLQSVSRAFAQHKVEGRANKGLPVVWHTPDGMPIVQAYAKMEATSIYLFHAKYQITVNRALDKLDGRRQVSGIAPNFVHSMDAAHLRTTVRRLAGEGITSMMAVHDSFGTHAGNMERLAEVTREEFVTMHKAGLLDVLRAELLDRAPQEVVDQIPEVPASGSLDLEGVKESLYFFA